MRKYIYIVMAIFVAGLIVVAGVRFLSGEDNWVCKDGKWVRHGNPAAEKPTSKCL
ncbi:MAG: hypothetical protein WC437_03700 [Patescibacteria group bacterium]